MIDQEAAGRIPDDRTSSGRSFGGPFLWFAGLAALVVVLMVVKVAAEALTAPPYRAYFVDDPAPAPRLELTGTDGRPLSLASMVTGGPVLVFFGYTHCPDVCPATIGTVGLAIDEVGGGSRAIFASIDPERDTVPWLAEFARFMPAGFRAVTGTPDEVATAAAAWGVRYARVESGSGDPGAYTMSHTADVFLIDAAGRLRARFPFGTEADVLADALRAVVADSPAERPVASAPPTATEPPTSPPAAVATATPVVPSAAPVAWLRSTVVSSSIWAGGPTPVVLTLADATGPIADTDARIDVRLVATDGARTGDAVTTTPVRPSGIDEVSFVATLSIPSPGPWRLEIERLDAAGTVVARGTVDVVVLDQGGSAALGRPAPTIDTLAADDVEALTYLTTDPLPDARLYATSTGEALASGRPFVFVVDSIAFKVTPACGQAVVLARRLLDRWEDDVTFIHHEPYAYDVVTQQPQLRRTLADPELTVVADAWGVGAPPWGVGSMPWIFIVDGDGIVRAKYQGVAGSADVDVVLSMLTAEAQRG